ncbi:ABC transporter ATP-binding protein [Flavobacterium xinjiangense]|uniref:Lipopolysaccharide transport system ATP-binding protein n=1 Tax=Flavobacterium xinjiangense TaxID=178356 RepID=A0A1M7MVQ4_9FLAO|nr:ABC transporter ATP-binding protein [Flavobacterium xinjiangense]SHM95109.1 lipopolysaccharide transport system ATP-binding protein [Flavobacterium xinjiangense]
MSKDIILKAENISKQYRLGQVGTGTLSHDLNRWWHQIRGKENPYLKIGDSNNRSTKGTSDYVWALQDINFDLMHGEVLGIIGKNGAGKSTLLKILSKVTAPTTGSIKSRGRIASLLEVGTGFNPELTGRENVYLNGAILGMTKKEVTSKLDEIIDFSGCERYIDTPVKRYSSGMTVRLAFAVAAFLEPEILVIDEVLAVGDDEFQKKAIGKMQDISRTNGRTVIFVSHNMAAVRKLCSRCIVLNNGCSVFSGSTNAAIDFYINQQNKLTYLNPVINKIKEYSKGPKILQCELTNIKGIHKSFFSAGEIISLDLIIQPDLEETRQYAAVWFIYNSFDEQFAICSSGKMNNIYYPKQTTLINCKIDSAGLLPGDYSIRFVLHVPGDDNFEDWQSAINFNILSHDVNNTGFEYTSIWSPKTFLKSEWS